MCVGYCLCQLRCHFCLKISSYFQIKFSLRSYGVIQLSCTITSVTNGFVNYLTECATLMYLVLLFPLAGHHFIIVQCWGSMVLNLRVSIPWVQNNPLPSSSPLLPEDTETNYMGEVGSYIREVLDQGWICYICNYQSTSLNNMRRHVKSVHLQIKDLPCTLCEMMFATVNNQQRHYKTKHNLKLSTNEIEQMTQQHYQWNNKLKTF